jgi:signal transduction histidine kinase
VVTAICTAAGIGIALLASNGDATVQDWSINYLVFATAWLLGDATRNRREAALELAARAAQLERTRELEAGRAVAEERNRIAREMHDVIAHHVSMMVVQAEAGPVVVHRDPDRAAASFDAISATGRQALTEMRRLLGVLRPDERGRLTPQPEPTGPAAQPDPAGLAPQPDPNRLAPLAPQPGASDVPAAVAAMRASGLDVDLAETGRVRPLPPTVDLAAYRIVQEALTNVLKHAGPARAVVRVDYGEDAVTVEVTNDGAGGSKPRSLDGHGLIGMRERAGLVGGDLQAGPAPDGGWRVHARLPLLPVPST